MQTFPFVDASGPRLVLIALAFGGTAIAIPLHYMTTVEVVPPAQRGAVFGTVAGIGALSGLVAPFLTRHPPREGHTTPGARHRGPALKCIAKGACPGRTGALWGWLAVHAHE